MQACVLGRVEGGGDYDQNMYKTQNSQRTNKNNFKFKIDHFLDIPNLNRKILLCSNYYFF